MWGGIPSAIAAEYLAKKAAIAKEHDWQIREAIADRDEIRALQLEYQGWVRPPQMVKRYGKWFAVVEHPPSVPRVHRRNTTS